MQLISILNKKHKKDMPFIGCLESQRGGRPENQDCAVHLKNTLYGRLVIVCDGMGGGPGGAIASNEAVKSIKDYFQILKGKTSDKNQVLQDAIKSANDRLRQLQKEDTSLHGMGTTCVCLLIDNYSAMVAHVGDSRLYQLRSGNRHWRTWDHSCLFDQIKEQYPGMEGKEVEDAIEIARTSPNCHIISRALGVCDEVDIETHELAYEAGDRFVLCTDGIWGAMPEQELVTLLNAKDTGGALSATLSRVEEIGQECGGMHDNYTLAILQTTYNSNLEEKMTYKARLIIGILSIICFLSIITCFVLGFRGQKVPTTGDDVPNVQAADSCLMDSIIVLQEEIAKRDTLIVSLQDSIEKTTKVKN